MASNERGDHSVAYSSKPSCSSSDNSTKREQDDQAESVADDGLSTEPKSFLIDGQGSVDQYEKGKLCVK